MEKKEGKRGEKVKKEIGKEILCANKPSEGNNFIVFCFLWAQHVHPAEVHHTHHKRFEACGVGHDVLQLRKRDEERERERG